MYADLLAQADDRHARDTAAFGDFAQRAERIERAAFIALAERQVGQRSIGHKDRVRRADALDHIEPVGQQRTRPRGLIALEHRAGQDGSEHRGDRASTTGIALGLLHRELQQLIGACRSSFPQVAEPDHHVGIGRRHSH